MDSGPPIWHVLQESVFTFNRVFSPTASQVPQRNVPLKQQQNKALFPLQMLIVVLACMLTYALLLTFVRS